MTTKRKIRPPACVKLYWCAVCKRMGPEPVKHFWQGGWCVGIMEEFTYQRVDA